MRYIWSVIFVAALWSCSHVERVSFDPRVSRSVVTVDSVYGF
jgi:hypothetical protein